MSFVQSIAQAALDMASLPDADQETQNSEEKSKDLGNESVQTGSYKSPTVSDEGEDGNDHLPSQHTIPENSLSEHNEAGTPPTQAEISEAPTPQAHEAEDPGKPGPVAVVDFAANPETPVPQSQDNTVDALFDDYDDYESQLDESPNQSGTSQAESSDELFVRQPRPSHEVKTDTTTTNEGNNDEQTVPSQSSPAVSVASVENRAVETQPGLHEHPENTTAQNVETTADHGEDLQGGLVASQGSTIPNEEAQLDPQVESGDSEHDQASQEEIKEIGQRNSGATENSIQGADSRSKVPIAHMELSFEENPDQDISQDIEPLTPPDQDQSQTEALAHRESIEESRPVSIMESTEIVGRNHSQASEGYANEEAESQHSPLEVASEPVAKQEEDEEKPAIPELQSPRLKVDCSPREVKTEETHNSPEQPTQSEVDEKESPVPEDRTQPGDASPAPKEAAPEQEEKETPKPRERKPLPVGPLLNRPQKAKPAPKAPRKRKLGIYDFFYESDPEDWPKKSRIARPQPDDKPKAKKAAANTNKKRSREEQEEEEGDHVATAAASDASEDEALAVKKREPKKPRGASKAAKEPKLATEKKKRGPKPGAKKPGPKKKKTEELSKPVVESDFDNDSEFVAEANNEDHSEEE
ncbi:hypothetical protein KJ359_010936 [Pestalotiopsis sp. 9143b]|nr:hypothetical protein KJ359_010936 [Pestalotiopsis sp. 9143b]